VSPSTTRVTLTNSVTAERIGVSIGSGEEDVGMGVAVGVGTGDRLTQPKIKLDRRSKKIPIPKTKFLFSVFTN